MSLGKYSGLFALVLLCSQIAAFGQADAKATKETRRLYANMKKMSGKGILFGQQNSQTMTRDGVDFNGKAPYPSDCVNAVGEFPAVHGFDFNPVNDDHRLMHDEIIDAYRRGGIITISWHAHNPISGAGHKDKTGNSMKELVPGGSCNAVWQAELDKKVEFFKSLTVDETAIPVLFRPFHEHTHNGFWWGIDISTSQEYIAAYRYTVDYLRDHGVHNLLLVYSPYSVVRTGKENMEARYPGDDYVDFVALDQYGRETYEEGEKPWKVFNREFLQNCELTVQFANGHGKPVVIAEIGIKEGLDNSSKTTWYADLLEMIKSDPYGRQFIYMMVWQNSANNYWIPLPDDRHHADFKKFHADPYTLFEHDLPDMYRKPNANGGQ